MLEYQLPEGAVLSLGPRSGRQCDAGCRVGKGSQWEPAAAPPGQGPHPGY